MDGLTKSFFSKILTFYLFLRYPELDGKRRYFLRFYYIGHFLQLKKIHKDLIVKKPYAEITFFGEFQQELLYVLPYAYWHYKNGTLKKTVSCKYTRDFYFFSPEHEERFARRNYLGNYKFDIPHGPHSNKISKFRWKQVPLKSYYKNNSYVYEKPVLIIANRYNSEWNSSPVSYLSLEVLRQCFDLLKNRYQIVYNRPESSQITNDNSDILELHDKEMIKREFPEIILLDDLYNRDKGKVNSFNHLQLLVYANSKRFISVHGGTSALASYFGGQNIIYSKQGHEHPLNEFQNVFTKLSGAKIHVCKDYKTLIETIKMHF